MRASLSAEEARGLALRAQLIGDATLREPIDVLDRLGCIQLDSVNTLARNHMLVPFSRLGSYSEAQLLHSIYKDKRGFEYWGHVASWMPISEFRYFLPRMRRYQETGHPWWRDLRSEHAAIYPAVLDRVKAEGPIGAAAFDDPRQTAGTWWDWKPAKLVLEDLFRQGLVMSADRTPGFARLYDLTERVLPADLDLRDPGQLESSRHLLKRGLAGLGVAMANEMSDYFRLIPAEQPREALRSLVGDEEIVEVKVEGWPKPAYVLPEALDDLPTIPEHRPAFLAPFDNVMWERKRVERIFGFHYRVEIYVPEPKRQYGYYVMPLLAHGTLCGRADLKLDRAESVLRVRGLWLEGAEPEEAQQAVESLAQHLGARDIDLPG